MEPKEERRSFNLHSGNPCGEFDFACSETVASMHSSVHVGVGRPGGAALVVIAAITISVDYGSKAEMCISLEAEQYGTSTSYI